LPIVNNNYNMTSPLRGDDLKNLLLPRVQQDPLHPFGGHDDKAGFASSIAPALDSMGGGKPGFIIIIPHRPLSIYFKSG
jgi:hypothetical protein